MQCRPGPSPPGPGERLRSPPSQGAGTERGTVSFQTGNPRTLTRFDVRVGPQRIEARHVRRKQEAGGGGPAGPRLALFP